MLSQLKKSNYVVQMRVILILPPIYVLCVSSHFWTFSILHWSILINHHHDDHERSVAIQLRVSESLGRRSRHWDSWLAVQLTTTNVDVGEDEDGAHYHGGNADNDHRQYCHLSILFGFC